MAVLGPKVESVLLALARPQHGAVTRDQLLVAGLSRHTVQRLVTAGRLLPVHRGVYLVADAVQAPLALEAAALLACRPRALLSHHTAAPLWRLPCPADDSINVTVVGRHRKSPEGVRVHFLSALPRWELRRHHGLPITSPSLTILDLAGCLSTEELTRALNEARVLRIVTDQQLRATLDHHPQRRGARALRRLLDAERGPKITRSEAERRALELMCAHGIEPDASDVPIGPYRLDFLFRRERLVVEVDGYRYHSGRKRFVDDRRRVAYLAARGLQVFPLTWSDLHEGAEAAMVRLIRTLEHRRGA